MLWEWFLELDAARSFAEGGAQAISFQEIYAWSQLMKYEISREEVAILRAMDSRRIRIWNSKAVKGAPDRLIDIRDTQGIASFFRSVRSDKT